jgi:hypothetical protein
LAADGHGFLTRWPQGDDTDLRGIGNAGQATAYLVRPLAEMTLDRLSGLFPRNEVEITEQDFTAFLVDANVPWVPPQFRGEASWGGAISLVGWSAQQVGAQLHVTLYWQANINLARSYTAFVHLLDTEDNLVTQLDRLPEGYPTIDWVQGERVIDTYTLDLPPDLDAGQYFVQSGFYHLPSDERLGEPVVLGPVSLVRP